MKNPYIKDDNSIDDIIKDLPFIPEKFDTFGFLKGLAIGGVAAFLLTNQNAQSKVLKAIAKAGDLFEMSIEEIKERYEDAKAELEAESN